MFCSPRPVRRASTRALNRRPARLINYWAGNAEKFLAVNHPKPHSPVLGVLKKLTTVYRPYPVVGVITPWNFPFLMPGADVIPALAAGAAVLTQALRGHSV